MWREIHYPNREQHTLRSQQHDDARKQWRL
jgi:hypothetical protein